VAHISGLEEECVEGKSIELKTMKEEKFLYGGVTRINFGKE
jgi:hypothetical protein